MISPLYHSLSQNKILVNPKIAIFRTKKQIFCGDIDLFQVSAQSHIILQQSDSYIPNKIAVNLHIIH